MDLRLKDEGGGTADHAVEARASDGGGGFCNAAENGRGKGRRLHKPPPTGRPATAEKLPGLRDSLPGSNLGAGDPHNIINSLLFPLRVCFS